MDKYKCNGCGEILNEDQIELHEEFSQAWGRTVSEEWWVCPICGESVAEYTEDDDGEDN